jgi:transposase
LEGEAMIAPIFKNVAGLDVHKMVVVGTVLVEQEDGSIKHETRQFGTFKRDRRQMCQWLRDNGVELVAIESTGIYWKSIYATLEREQILAYVVNARHVKNVPGRKTDVSDSHWLASLLRVGLLKPSFIPTVDFRELRMISRHRAKLCAVMAAEKNRLGKVLDDAGIRLSGVATDIDGVSAQEIIEGIIEGKPIDELIACARGKLKAKTDELRACLDEDLSERHKFLLRELQKHIQFLKSEIAGIDKYLFAAMSPYQKQWEILQTIPGVDQVAAMVLIIEIGIEMEKFGSAEQLSSWAGMCPGNNESAGKRKSGKTRKGNQAIRRILCEIANAARRTKSQFKAKYESLVIRRGHKRSIIAIGHKILRIVFVMLKNINPYYDPGINYEELIVDRNAPRWLKALKKYGYLPKTA